MTKKLMVLAALAGLVLIVASGCTAGEKKIELKDLRDKVSYSIGMNIGADFKRQVIKLHKRRKAEEMV